MKPRSSRSTITIDDVSVEVVRKRVKRINIRVYPPDGRVRVSAPLRMAEETVRLALTARLGWIRGHRLRLAERPRPVVQRYESGESHPVEGRRFTLRVVEVSARPQVTLVGDTLELRVRPGTGVAKRAALLDGWYRSRLNERVAPLVAEWQRRMGVSAAEVRVRRMKTLWGSCNTRDRRIWLNVELIRRPPRSLEYVLVHELAHLIERSHGARFQRVMDRFLPDWRERRAELNATPLGCVPVEPAVPGPSPQSV